MLFEPRSEQWSKVMMRKSVTKSRRIAHSVSLHWRGGLLYRGLGNYDVKGSVCLVLKYCTPSLFSPSPLCGAISQ